MLGGSLLSTADNALLVPRYTPLSTRPDILALLTEEARSVCLGLLLVD